MLLQAIGQLPGEVFIHLCVPQAGVGILKGTGAWLQGSDTQVKMINK